MNVSEKEREALEQAKQLIEQVKARIRKGASKVSQAVAG